MSQNIQHTPYANGMQYSYDGEYCEMAGGWHEFPKFDFFGDIYFDVARVVFTIYLLTFLIFFRSFFFLSFFLSLSCTPFVVTYLSQSSLFKKRKIIIALKKNDSNSNSSLHWEIFAQLFVFEMAAMSFPCNGLIFVCVN